MILFDIRLKGGQTNIIIHKIFFVIRFFFVVNKNFPRILHDFVCKLVCRIYFFFGFYSVRVKGNPSTSKEAPIMVVAPHSSMFDALPVAIMGAPSPVAKGELSSLTLFSSMPNLTVLNFLLFRMTINIFKLTSVSCFFLFYIYIISVSL